MTLLVLDSLIKPLQLAEAICNPALSNGSSNTITCSLRKTTFLQVGFVSSFVVTCRNSYVLTNAPWDTSLAAAALTVGRVQNTYAIAQSALLPEVASALGVRLVL